VSGKRREISTKRDGHALVVAVRGGGNEAVPAGPVSVLALALARRGKSHHACASQLPGLSEQVAELDFAAASVGNIALQHADHGEQQSTHLHERDRARDVEAILLAPRVRVDTLDRPRIGGPGPTLGRLLNAADAPLQQVPGVGPITALGFVLTIDDPRRFSNSRKVGAYLGLRPRQRDSGDRS
jgi:transposase